MTFLTLLETLQTIKKEGIHTTAPQIKVLSTNIQEAHGSNGIHLLQQVLVSLGLKHEEEQNLLLKALPYESSSHYVGFYNHSLYQKALPLCQFAYLSEKNGIPEEHACKLATVFSNVQDLLAYLAQFKQENSYRYLLHDACLFDLPEPKTCDFAQWRRLANRHLANPRFRELFSHAQALEKIGHTGKHHEKRTLDRTSIKLQRKALAHTSKQYKDWATKPVDQFNETQRSERQERLNQLSKDKAEQRHKLAALCRGLPLTEVDMLVLEAFFECYQNTHEAHQLLIKNGISPQNMDLFNTLKPINDDNAIPDLIIDGQELGYTGLYLKKLDVLSKKGMVLAACLGKLTNCCQYLGGAGHECVIHGITSSSGGFYVVFQGDPTNPALDDPILAQSWVWKGQENGLCLDSIETATNKPQEKQAIIDLFRLLGHRLCHKFGISKVNTGAESGITDEVALQNYPVQKEHFFDYAGYCDSQAQLPLANNAMPYLFYGQSSSAFQNLIAEEIQRFFYTLFRTQNALKENKVLQQIIAFALYTKRNNLLDLLHQAAAPSSRQKELEILINVNKKYYEQLNSEIVDIPLIEQGAFAGILNDAGQSALHLAISEKNIATFDTLLKLNFNLDIQNKYANTVLLYVLKENLRVDSKVKRDIVTKLIKAGANLDIQDNDGKTSLMIATQNDELDIVIALIEHGANIEVLDEEMKTTLFWAVENKNVAIFEYLINQGAKTNIISHSGDNLLTFAAKHLNQKVIIKLLHTSSYCSAKVLQHQDTAGDNILLLAAHHHLTEVIKVILANPHCSPELLQQNNNNGENILIVTIKKRLTEIVQLILESPHSNLELILRKQDIQGRNALIWAAIEQNKETVQAILENPCANTELLQQQDIYGNSAFIRAIMSGCTETAQTILSSPHCTVEVLMQQHKNGSNALCWAAKMGRTKMVQIILASPHCSIDLLTAFIEQKITIKPEIQSMIEERIGLLQNEEQNKRNNQNIHSMNYLHCFFNTPSNEEKDEIESTLCTSDSIQISNKAPF